MEKYLVGRDLKLMRLGAELTTSKMAEYIGVKSRKTIENWESDQSEPGINQFIKFCDICNVEAHKLVNYAVYERKIVKEETR